MTSIQELHHHQALDDVLSKIRDAEQKAGREKGSVDLVAVSKTFFGEHIHPALLAGQRIFGENRVQESLQKWPELKNTYADVDLHLIGPLQSNKVKDAVGLFDCIQSVDRLKLARALANEIQRTGRNIRLLVQVNTGEEPQKAGVLPEDVDSFLQQIKSELGLNISGLMCIPPSTENPAPHFALLSDMAKRNGLDQLSMGMSADFETAIEFGATYVRVGSAIFGARPKPQS